MTKFALAAADLPIYNQKGETVDAYLAKAARPALVSFLEKVVRIDFNLYKAFRDAEAGAEAAGKCVLDHDSDSVARIKADAARRLKLVRIYLVAVYGIDKGEARAITGAIETWAAA